MSSNVNGIPAVEAASSGSGWRISVVTPAYNAEKTLARTIESVLGQTYQDFEYIIIDDGSGDRTLEIAQEYQRKYPEKITVKSVPNAGPAAARNYGLTLCSGDFFYPLDSDDYIEPDTFERAIAVLKTDVEMDVCFWGYKSFNENEDIFNFYYSKEFQYPETVITGKRTFVDGYVIAHWSALWKLEMIRKGGICYYPGASVGEDTYFWIRCLLAARKVGHFQGDNLCHMEKRGSIMHTPFNKKFLIVSKVMKQLEEDVIRDYPDQLEELFPSVCAVGIEAILMVIKKMMATLPLKEYLSLAQPVREEMGEVDKNAAFRVFTQKQKLEYKVCQHSLTAFYFAGKLWYGLVRKPDWFLL